MAAATARAFAHPVLGEEVPAIGGRYVFMKEVRLPWSGGREVLYHVGAAAADRSCCGAGGVAFAAVAGFVCAWHAGATPDGRPTTRVEPVAAAADRAELARRIREREHVHQVNFL
jgi:hypothetical protein